MANWRGRRKLTCGRLYIHSCTGPDWLGPARRPGSSLCSTVVARDASLRGLFVCLMALVGPLFISGARSADLLLLFRGRRRGRDEEARKSGADNIITFRRSSFDFNMMVSILSRWANIFFDCIFL